MTTLFTDHFFSAASKLRKAGVYSRVDQSNTSIGKRYSRNDELGTPFGVTVDFACVYHSFPRFCRKSLVHKYCSCSKWDNHLTVCMFTPKHFPIRLRLAFSP